MTLCLLTHGQNNYPARSVRIALQSVKSQGFFFVLMGGNRVLAKLMPRGDLTVDFILLKAEISARLASSYRLECIKHALETRDCRLLTTDYSLGTKYGLWYKTQTMRYGLGIFNVYSGIKCRLQTYTAYQLHHHNFLWPPVGHRATNRSPCFFTGQL